MKIYHDLSEVQKSDKTVLTVGTFDGVHLGHQALLNILKEKAKASGSRSMILTFDPHPREVVFKGGDIKLLMTTAEKLRVFEDLGIDEVFIINFTHEFSELTADEFFSKFILNGTGIEEIIVGHDHKFGKDRKGDESFIRSLAQKLGFKVTYVEAVMQNQSNISSTQVRKRLAEGDVRGAAELLGREYEIFGEVVHGDKRGRDLGFPTANLECDSENKILPASGVYAALVELDGKTMKGVVNVGRRPTFNLKDLAVEVHLLDFPGYDLYGKNLRVRFTDRIRGEMRFIAKDDLVQQIKKDIEQAKALLEKR
ncbi:MAG: bifunctional riboflavin kinase/FAD synthetase [Ignavibacteriales bacterium]|mgnify:CR=1 FL=1|nr:MAG: bifunctional riboflavin kinase/FAD synthetase [Ignavibacteriaceae bacterium]MBW7873103.1 bifunctional riboflavin kinase/FAD synthetase [Ignavibacteria bacterium]MCZ2142746.1 bifunctional riboflavin kinase/FAD synthetase [Ignavibacteriales bacterium]MBV6443840.1 Riboflavin biosynthesis protein RibF [Ignavibacteriaceae bacterium]MBZ0196317.1 bifunctional riboflavin kinase/FAD synthetase [Ignavibacteriaceae bacterium]